MIITIIDGGFDIIQLKHINIKLLTNNDFNEYTYHGTEVTKIVTENINPKQVNLIKVNRNTKSIINAINTIPNNTNITVMAVAWKEDDEIIKQQLIYKASKYKIIAPYVPNAYPTKYKIPNLTLCSENHKDKNINIMTIDTKNKNTKIKCQSLATAMIANQIAKQINKIKQPNKLTVIAICPKCKIITQTKYCTKCNRKINYNAIYKHPRFVGQI